MRNEADGVVLRKPSSREVSRFLEMFRTQLGSSEISALDYLGLSWDELAGLFASVGELRAVVENDDVAGFVWLESRGRELHIHGIVLDPAFRGRGIGRQVFAGLQREYRGMIDIIELGVQEENESAIAFYSRIGFVTEPTATAPGFRIMRMKV